jgi:hypothetical protein
VVDESRLRRKTRGVSRGACVCRRTVASHIRTVRFIRNPFFRVHIPLGVPAIVIINDEAARRFFPGEDPVGKRIAVNYLALGSRIKGAPRMREIVGVVSNVRQRALDLPPEPAIYMPYTQDETYHGLPAGTAGWRPSGCPQRSERTRSRPRRKTASRENALADLKRIRQHRGC